MSTFSTLTAGLAEWQGRAGRLFTQTDRSIYITEFFVCVMCLTAEGTVSLTSLFRKIIIFKRLDH